MRERILIDAVEVQYGFPLSADLFNEKDGLPLVRIRDVVPGFSATRTTEYPGPAYEVQNGDFLIGMDGEFNIAPWRGGRALLNQRVCRIVPKKIENMTSAVTVKHLSDKVIKRIKLPFYSNKEQTAIGNVLQTIDNTLGRIRLELSKLDGQVKSLFNERRVLA